jgi:hypothetical protein
LACSRFSAACISHSFMHLFIHPALSIHSFIHPFINYNPSIHPPSPNPSIHALSPPSRTIW